MLAKKPLVLALLAIVLLPVLRAQAASGTVTVYYAASLIHLNEKGIGPAFDTATGYTYQGTGVGSLAIANQIKGHLATPDVIELADPTINDLLRGAANGNYVSWYFTFARSELVIGFDPHSRFAPLFQKAQQGKIPWYRALEAKGLKLGRTDPNLDPKGYRTIFMAHLAQQVYHLHGFVKRVLGDTENPAQIFPEEVLVARLTTGQLDAGIFYLTEVRDLGIPFVSLPAKVNLGSPKYAALYATQHFRTSSGSVITGAPIEYTITIPSTVTNEAGAEAFVRFVLGKRGRSIASAGGLLPARIMLHGDRNQVPLALVRYIGNT